LFIKKGLEGKGVFSEQSIKKGKSVFVFANRIKKINHKPGCNCKVCCRCIQIGEYDFLYPKRGSFGWYINHSCDPNCGIKGNKIVSIKNIHKGDEITIDYSTTNADLKWEMKCSCNAKNCRNVIKSVQYLPKKRFLQLKRFMPLYVAKNNISPIA